MVVRRYVVVAGTLLGALSCSRAPSTSSPAPGTGPTAAPAASRRARRQPRRPAAPRPAGACRRRETVSPSCAPTYVATVMQSIAGHENEPADRVFKNVQVLKGITAAQLVHKMDKDYATAMSWNCTNCHRLAPQGNFASDTSNDKKRARFMQQMVNDINLVQLPKLYPKDTPVVTCATCHRGYNEPPPGDYLAPERGKPGAPPAPPPPAGR